MHALDVAFGLNLVYVQKLTGCVTKYNMAWLSWTFKKATDKKVNQQCLSDAAEHPS
jgi:hypothetical protein